MAHPEQENYFEHLNVRFGEEISLAENIVEIGSSDLNGSVRKFFKKESLYFGVDLHPGKGVDSIVPGELLQLPNSWADISISTECFEHAKNWKEIFLNMIRITKHEGLVFLTFAGIGRNTHGTIDCHDWASKSTNDYYSNLSPNDIGREIELGRYFSRHSFEVNFNSNDTYFWGIRGNDEFDQEFMSLENLLSRARGQLGMQVMRSELLRKGNLELIEKNNSLEKELAGYRNDEARIQLEKDKSEFEKERMIFNELKSRSIQRRFIDLLKRKLKGRKNL